MIGNECSYVELQNTLQQNFYRLLDLCIQNYFFRISKCQLCVDFVAMSLLYD